MGGRAVAHSDSAILRNARFVVQRAGWERTVRERRKRVHAVVRGELVGRARKRPTSTVTYNPYRADHFQIRATGQPACSALMAAMNKSLARSNKSRTRAKATKEAESVIDGATLFISTHGGRK
jgi:hypothetical protein